MTALDASACLPFAWGGPHFRHPSQSWKVVRMQLRGARWTLTIGSRPGRPHLRHPSQSWKVVRMQLRGPRWTLTIGSRPGAQMRWSSWRQSPSRSNGVAMGVAAARSAWPRGKCRALPQHGNVGRACRIFHTGWKTAAGAVVLTVREQGAIVFVAEPEVEEVGIWVDQ